MEHTDKLAREPSLDAPLPQQTPETLYKKNSIFLNETLLLFLPKPAHEDVKTGLARRLKSEFGPWAKGRYSHLGYLRLLHETLSPRNDLSEYLELPFDRGFPLWLRDRDNIAPQDIAAVINVSEGTARTRLLSARERIFEKLSLMYAIEFNFSKNAPFQPQNAADGHFCIRAQHAIENWSPDFPLVSSQIKPFEVTPPPDIRSAMQKCKKCAAYAQSRVLGHIHAKLLLQKSGFEKNEAEDFPLGALLVKKNQKLSLNWGAAPWYLKIVFEGILATSLVVGVVLAAPRIKALYELWLERRFDLYSIAELASNLGTELLETEDHHIHPIAPHAAETMPIENLTSASTIPFSAAPAGKSSPEKLSIQPETEFAGRESVATVPNKVHRLFLKTDSPETLSAKVLDILGTVEHQAADPSIPPGSSIPGGVLFDVFVPAKEYTSVINQVAKLGESKLIITAAKERIVPGKARIRIWIQRI